MADVSEGQTAAPWLRRWAATGLISVFLAAAAPALSEGDEIISHQLMWERREAFFGIPLAIPLKSGPYDPEAIDAALSDLRELGFVASFAARLDGLQHSPVLVYSIEVSEAGRRLGLEIRGSRLRVPAGWANTVEVLGPAVPLMIGCDYQVVARSHLVDMNPASQAILVGKSLDEHVCMIRQGRGVWPEWDKTAPLVFMAQPRH